MWKSKLWMKLESIFEKQYRLSCSPRGEKNIIFVWRELRARQKQNLLLTFVLHVHVRYCATRETRGIISNLTVWTTSKIHRNTVGKGHSNDLYALRKCLFVCGCELNEFLISLLGRTCVQWFVSATEREWMEFSKIAEVHDRDTARGVRDRDSRFEARLEASS